MAKIQDIDIPYLEFAEAAAPGTPASGVVRIYAKTDGSLYQKDDAGLETGLAGGGGGAPDTAPYVTTAADGGLSAEKVRTDLISYHPDNLPAAVNAVSREFDGSSGGTYSWISAPSASSDNSTIPGHLYVENNANDGSTYRYYRAAYTPGATAFTVAAKIEPSLTYNVNEVAQWGIAVLDSSDTLIWRVLYITSSAATGVLTLRMNETGGNTIEIQSGFSIPAYLMLQRTSGTTFTSFYSFNGKTWVQFGSGTAAGTVGKVALVSLSGGTAVKYCAIDWIRVFDSQLRNVGA